MPDARSRDGDPRLGENASFFRKAVGWVLAATGSVGLVAATVLMVEGVRLLEDPSYVPSCSIDAVLSCGSVMTSDQAEAFGFPNPLLGVAGFAAFAAFGVAVLCGANLGRRLWLAIEAGAAFAFAFVCWLIFQSLYRIEALCPYCMVVWAAVIVAFVYVTAFNLSSGNIRVPSWLVSPAAFFMRYHGAVTALLFVVVVALIGQAFWEHWRTIG